MANWCESKYVLREIREKASDSLKNCHAKPLQIIQISEHICKTHVSLVRIPERITLRALPGLLGWVGMAEWHFQGAAGLALALIQAQISVPGLPESLWVTWEVG